MSSEEVLEKVKGIIVEQLGVADSAVTMEASFIDDLGADSLDIVELVMALEEEFDIEIPDADAEKVVTVGDVVDYIKENVKIISCMGTGNKLDPTKFEITDIHKTTVCPLARVIRKELKKRNIKNVKVLYSKEEPRKTDCKDENAKAVPASISFVPSVAGLIIAGEVIKDTCQINGK